MTLSIRIHTTLQHACFIEAPFGAYTSMVVHLFLCSIEFFSREPTLGVSGNSDGCRWLSDPTSRVQIGEQQPQVETLSDRGVSKSHNLNLRDTLKPLMFFFVIWSGHQMVVGRRASRKRLGSQGVFLRIECWHLELRQDPQVLHSHKASTPKEKAWMCDHVVIMWRWFWSWWIRIRFAWGSKAAEGAQEGNAATHCHIA